MNRSYAPQLVLVALAVAFAALAVVSAMLVPIGEGPDEPGHLTYVHHLSVHGTPTPGDPAVPLSHHPSLYYRVASWAVALFPASLGLESAYAARFTSALFGLLALFGVWVAARAAFADQANGRALAAWATAFALLPGMVISASVAGNDMAVVALSTWAYALIFRLVATERPGVGTAIALGVALAAAAMTKTSGCLPAIVMVVAAAVARRRAVWGMVGIATAIFGVGLLASGFYLPNLLAHGDPFLTQVIRAHRPELVIPFPINENYLGHVLARLASGFLGELVQQDIRVSRPILLVAFAAFGMAAGGVFCLVRDRVVRPKAPRERDRAHDPFDLRRSPEPAPAAPEAMIPMPVLVASLVAIAITLGSLVVWSTKFYGPYGRYLHVVIGPFAVLFVAGMARMFPRGIRWLGPTVAIGLALSAAYTIYGDLWPHYHARAAKWARGDVLHYDDAGHPNLAPHWLQSAGPTGRFEPWGTYSKARVPEMNVVWGSPSVTFRYESLDPRVPYQVRVTYYGGRELGKFGLVGYQVLRANGVMVHGPMPVTYEPRELSYHLPNGVIGENGRLDLVFTGVTGHPAAVAEVWLERPWVSAKGIRVSPEAPRVGERAQAILDLGNRDPEAAHGVDAWLFAKTATGLARVTGATLKKPIRPEARTQVGLVAALPASVAGAPLYAGLRRVDRGPWAIVKGATHLGPAGAKEGDLGARDLHTAAANPAGGVVLEWRPEEKRSPAGPWRIRVRYRAARRGELALLDDAGKRIGYVPLPETGTAWKESEGAVQGTRFTRLAVFFEKGDGIARIDEVSVWSEAPERGFHLYPTGKTVQR